MIRQGLQTMFEKDKQRMIDFKDWSDEDVQSIKANSFIICGDHDVVTTSTCRKNVPAYSQRTIDDIAGHTWFFYR